MPTMRFLVASFLLVLVLGTPSLGAPPLRYSCFTSNIFSTSGTSDDFYRVIDHIVNDVQNTGYATASTKSMWGLAQCRGDIKGSQCKSCVYDAGNQLISSCSKSRLGVIWYDNCLVKIHNHSFTGQVDNLNNFCMPGAPVTYNNKPYFNWKLNKMFVDIISEATSETSLFASGEVDLPNNGGTIYGMAQCTRDLTDTDCQACLDDLKSQLSCCDGKKEGRIMDGSCFVRFGQDPFMLA